MPIAINKGGRPPKTVDLRLVERLAKIHCTQPEVAAILGVSVDTLENTTGFSDVYKRGREVGRQSLRRAQYKAALAGNSTMLVWLGKQMLGQKDIVTTEHAGEVTIHDADLKNRVASLLGSIAERQRTQRSTEPIN